MCRSMSRVVVVAIVVLSFVLSTVPAFAAPQGGGKASVNLESGWLQSAIAWASEVIFGQSVKAGTSSKKKEVTSWNGSCVDPFGGCG